MKLNCGESFQTQVVATSQTLPFIGFVRKDWSLSHRFFEQLLIIFKPSRYLVKTRLTTFVCRGFVTLISVLSSLQRVFLPLKIHRYPGPCPATIKIFPLRSSVEAIRLFNISPLESHIVLFSDEIFSNNFCFHCDSFSYWSGPMCFESLPVE